MPPRILITHGRSRMAYVAARSLHRAGFEVHVSDASPLNMTRVSRAAHGFARTPNAFNEPVRFVERLAQVITQRKIDLVIPGHEDVFHIQAHADRLPPSVIVAAPPYQELSHAGDKLRIARTAESVGVAIPRTIEILKLDQLEEAASQLTFPLLIKTRRGSGGKGVQCVHSQETMVAHYHWLVTKYQWAQEQWPILQEYIAGGKLFGTCFLAKEGELKACFIERYVRCKQDSFGTSVLRERSHWSLLADATEKIVRTLRWTGIGHLDFIANASLTEAYLLEMNPRWWGALNLAVVNGFDFPRGLVTMLLDGEPAADAFQEVSSPRRSLWIVGELAACRAEVADGKLYAPLASLARILFPGNDCVYDDFHLRDPLPLAAELAHYVGRFVRARLNEQQAAFETVP